MEYASFYGGRKGSSFIIVKNYLDIPSMVQDFSRGGAFKGVNYDEYVIINTVNKNHPDNGKIFRRGYDYNSDRTIQAYRAYDANNREIINGTTQQYKNAIYRYDSGVIAGGAIYVGTIVGPAGRSPHLTLTTYDLAKTKDAQEGFEDQTNQGEYDITTSLVPGKYEENGQIKYNDAIKWCSTSFRDSYNDYSQAYIGFKIPYPVIEYTTTVVSPYNQSGQQTDTSSAVRLDDGSHPFYENWNFNIPKGIKGDTLKNFRVMVPTANDIIYTVDTTTRYSGYQDDIDNGRAILVYDYYNYDNIENPQKITYYIGDYNQITDFTIAPDGTLTIAFSHEDTIIYSKLIRKIDTITINEDSEGNQYPGRFIVKYNDGFSQTYDLDWVKDIRFETDQQGNYDGTVFIDYTISNSVEYPKLIKWINDISLASTNRISEDQDVPDVVEGTFAIEYNDGTSLVEYLKWVNNITLSSEGALTLHYSGNGEDRVISTRQNQNFVRWINDVVLENNGTLTITYNTGSAVEQQDPQTGEERLIWTSDKKVFDKAIKWVTGVNFDSNGNVIVNYNTGTSDVYENQIKWIQSVNLNSETGVFTIVYNQENIPNYSVRLKWPTSVDIVTKASENSEEGTGSQKVKVNYTTGESVQIGSPLNYIMQTKVTKDSHLIVLYADPAKRQSLINANKAYYFDRFNQWTDPATGYAGWLDLGSIYTDSGILIGLNLNINDIPTEEEIPTQEDIVTYLNQTYPDGLIGEHLAGKIITVGQPDGDKYFYGFDYNYISSVENTYKGWYYLGTFSNSSAVLSLQDEIPSGIQEDTLCFIIEDNYTVTYDLRNVVSTNPQTVIMENGTYRTTLVGTIQSVTVSMGGVDITNQVYNTTTSTIIIDSSNPNIRTVTGNLVITAIGV